MAAVLDYKNQYWLINLHNFGGFFFLTKVHKIIFDLQSNAVYSHLEIST